MNTKMFTVRNHLFHLSKSQQADQLSSLAKGFKREPFTEAAPFAQQTGLSVRGPGISPG